MKSYKIIVFILAFAAIFSCSEDTIGLENKGSNSGTVKDNESGDPLPDVKITTNPSSSTVITDANGEFLLEEILTDDYSVQAELDDYSTGFEPVTVTKDETSVVVIQMDALSSENEPPSKPNLVFPEHNALDVTLEVEFLWESIDPEEDEITYTLELRNGTTNELQSFDVVQDTMYTVSNLQISTNYFWQVFADDEVNDPVASNLSVFTTLTIPDNPFLFVRKEDENNVIYSGSAEPDNNGDPNPDVNVIQLTDETTNSFRPRKDINVNRIAFLRVVGSETHIFTMNLDGTGVEQVTSSIPVAGFRLSELDFTWAENGGKLIYPNFDRLISIDPDGGFVEGIYRTSDGSIISEVAVPQFDQDLLLIKTNSLSGYDARIFTYRLSTGVEETIILEGVQGAAGSVDITANADKVLYNLDLSGSQNNNYAQFESRIFVYDLILDTFALVTTDVILGENEYDARFSPTEGGMIWSRGPANTNAIPDIYQQDFDITTDDALLFTRSSMPDWE